MGEPGPAPAGLLVCGILTPPGEPLDRALELLAAEYGPPAEQGGPIPFDFTDYYEPELGPGLVRCWVGFGNECDPAELAKTKLRTRELERRIARADGRRAVNLDPGVLTLNNLVLASTKDHAHRICIGSGIFAELTLVFESGAFRPLPWTYPDYRTDACLRFLVRCRRLLLARSSPPPAARG